MKITIVEEANVDTEIIIKCSEVNNEIIALIEKLKVKSDKILAYDDKLENTLIPVKEILYCEYVDRVVYLYTLDNIYKTNFSLNELEDKLPKEEFFRCSKSFIINIDSIQAFKSDLGGRLIATLDNNEKICISRHYSKLFREKLVSLR